MNLRATQVREFLLVGGVTPLLYPLSWLMQRTLGLSTAEYAIGFATFYGAYLINDPHFAVTYFLFYENARARAFGTVFPRALRVGYWSAGIVAPIALLVWGAFGLHHTSPIVLGTLVQTMFLLVGWHYVKQGFGVLVVLSSRRGVFYTKGERATLLAHAYAGWAFAWANPADPGTLVEEKGLVFTTWSRSPELERGLAVVLAVTTLALVVMLGRKWRREARLPILTPLLGFLCSIWAWSIFSSRDPLARYVIPALHSVQYLFMVHMLKAGEATAHELAFSRTRASQLGLLLAGALGLGVLLFHVFPSALDGMLVPKASRFTDMGPTPYFAALYAALNIHHYLMDAVIWRKDNPQTQYLRETP